MRMVMIHAWTVAGGMHEAPAQRVRRRVTIAAARCMAGAATHRRAVDPARVDAATRDAACSLPVGTARRSLACVS